ncbi:MAG: hypothetical protein BWX76_00967 [Candidatus Cloacimonetes bacterium ADurb.Bin089]|nr:MAG: hypothetical protein BWX76_00967 [Candidatus Cloacimonetes bacterium ADurb.Bin089]
MKNCAFENLSRFGYFPFFVNPENPYNPVHPRPIKSLFLKKSAESAGNNFPVEVNLLCCLKASLTIL